MKKQFLILMMAGLFQSSIGQNYSHEFGKNSGEEFNLNNYPKDPAAEAVVIYDIGMSYFSQASDGFELIFERKMKIKILTKAGIDQANIEIPYYEENDKFEEITSLRGNTYNLENGVVRITSLNPINTFTEKYSENWYLKKLAMPDVKEGSIIEIEYIIKSPYLFNLRNWEFQQTIPVIYSEYTTKMIPFYEYTYIFQGASKFDDFNTYVETGMGERFGTVDYQNVVFTFVMKELQAFKDEEYITSIEDYIIKLDFQLVAVHRTDGTSTTYMTTWEKLNKDLLDEPMFGRYATACEKRATDITEGLNLGTSSALEKARLIDRYVKSNFSWNGYRSKMASMNIKDFIQSKSGNSADINLFLTGMLNAAGVEAFPVVLSTRDHGKIKLDYPFHEFFNYVVVAAKIDNSIVLLDATEPYSNFKEIPSRCFNDKGLIVQKDLIEWINLKASGSSSKEYYFKLQSDPDSKTINEQTSLVTSGYFAAIYREEYASDSKKLKEKLSGDNTFLSDSITTLNLRTIEEPFKIEYIIERPLETLEDKLIISPFCNTAISENLLTQPTRSYPVDILYREKNIFESTIKIPEGYKLLTTPGGLNIDNSMVNISFSTDLTNADVIIIKGVYEFKKDVYPVTEYSSLKSYINTIVEKFNEELIFVKTM